MGEPDTRENEPHPNGSKYHDLVFGIENGRLPFETRSSETTASSEGSSPPPVEKVSPVVSFGGKRERYFRNAYETRGQ